MKILWYSFIGYLLFVSAGTAAIDSTNDVALEGIEREIASFIDKKKNAIVAELDTLILIPEEDRQSSWHDMINHYVYILAVIDFQMAKKYFQQIDLGTIKLSSSNKNRPGVKPVTFETQVNEVKAIPAKTEAAIATRLDELILIVHAQRNDAWEDEVHGLLFDLALYDRGKASGYLKKIYKCIGESVVGNFSEPAKKAGGPPPPPPMLAKKGGPPPPPPMPGKNPGGPPPPPMPGKKAAAPEEQKAKPFVLTPSVLREMDPQEVLRLFNEHLDKLPASWNGQVEERVVVKTKYGSRVEIIRGAPDLGWNNIAGTLKRALVNKALMDSVTIDSLINERIDKVRSQLKIAPVTQSIEKESTKEPTKEDIEKQVTLLLANPKLTEMSWLVGVKSGIKKLDRLDHDQALKYQEDFIFLLPEERRFIKP